MAASEEGEDIVYLLNYVVGSKSQPNPELKVQPNTLRNTLCLVILSYAIHIMQYIYICVPYYKK